MNDTACTLTLPEDVLVQNYIVLSKLTFIEEVKTLCGVAFGCWIFKVTVGDDICFFCCKGFIFKVQLLSFLNKCYCFGIEIR